MLSKLEHQTILSDQTEFSLAEQIRSDILLLETDALHNLPVYDYATMLAASAESADVSLTMADGQILYEDGEYKTMDVEKLRADFRSVHQHYFD